MLCLYIINTEVPALGDSLSWDTNLFVCDITTTVETQLPTSLFRVFFLMQINSFLQLRAHNSHLSISWLYLYIVLLIFVGDIINISCSIIILWTVTNLNCSDITNDQLGISGETGHGGVNLYIYWMNSAATCTAVVQNYSWCVTPQIAKNNFEK